MKRKLYSAKLNYGGYCGSYCTVDNLIVEILEPENFGFGDFIKINYLSYHSSSDCSSLILDEIGFIKETIREAWAKEHLTTAKINQIFLYKTKKLQLLIKNHP